MNYKKYNDYELIYMVREHDDSSYDVLLEKYLPIIKRIANDYYNSYCHYGFDYDDFLQEGYIAFQQALLSYDEQKDSLFYSYVTLCIHRKILTFCKRMTCEKKNISDVNYVNYEDVSLIDDGPLMDDLLIHKEMISMIWDIVYTFPIEYTSVFELRMNQFHYQEIARLLDIKRRTAEFMYRRILNKIRKELNITL